MRKIVLTFGLISGLIISAMFVITIPFIDGISFEKGAIIGYASMLAASLFFAFAWFYPDEVIYVFFIIPMKIKWLAWSSSIRDTCLTSIRSTRRQW